MLRQEMARLGLGPEHYEEYKKLKQDILALGPNPIRDAQRLHAMDPQPPIGLDSEAEPVRLRFVGLCLVLVAIAGLVLLIRNLSL